MLFISNWLTVSPLAAMTTDFGIAQIARGALP
jgi:hypothetical protein